MPSPAQPTPMTMFQREGAERPRVDSVKLLQGASSVEIEHAGQRYLLRVTRENKLILTK